jgi:hypothetical protein
MTFMLKFELKQTAVLIKNSLHIFKQSAFDSFAGGEFMSTHRQSL